MRGTMIAIKNQKFTISVSQMVIAIGDLPSHSNQILEKNYSWSYGWPFRSWQCSLGKPSEK